MNIKKLNWWIGGSRRYEAIIPAAFSSLFTSKIYKTGSTYSTDYDFTALRTSMTGNIAYVDSAAAGGGDGSIGTPYNSLSTAVANTGFSIYKLKAGSIFNFAINSGLTLSREIAFEKYGTGNNPIVTCSLTTASWVAEGNPGVYYHTVASAIGSVMDKGTLDANGNATGLINGTNLAGVVATANRYFYDSGAGRVYVRLADDRAPDSNVVVMVSSTTTRLFRFAFNMSANTKFYMDSIDVFGGLPLIVTNTSSTFYWNFGIVNCKFSHGGQVNGAFFNGNCRGFIKDCRADYNVNDGFNYNNTTGFAFEWGCGSYRTGPASDSNNGSTSHSSFYIIRVKHTVEYNGGKGIQDINDVVSYNLGCISRNSVALTEAHRAGYASNSSTGNTTMWLIECIGPTDHNKFWNFNNSTMHIYDGTLGNLLQGTNQQDAGSVLDELTVDEVYI